MKRITFIRHAKSSWKYDVSDKLRPLKKRGIADATLISGLEKVSGIKPEFVFCSTANRTRETCNIFLKNLKFSSEKVSFEDELYDFGGNNVINFIKSISDDYENVIIFGHNYALTSIVNLYGDIHVDNIPTSGLVSITFNISSWSEFKPGKTDLVLFPKHFR
ncbi:SixA phosphatase family protein [Pontimicrobium sp. IMCC45349]|uniref:SixA phosphatase family protein n=1 Tax=Pontimicrobium sp. IMCC45349 TaxID=3391574 RepID=UPI00399F785E